MSFADHLIQQKAWAYKLKPSRDNAKALLTACNIAIPFQGNWMQVVTKNMRVNFLAGAPSINHLLTKEEAFEDLVYVDLIHDLYDGQPMQAHLIEHLLSFTTFLLPMCYNIKQLCGSKGSSELTYEIAKHFAQLPCPMLVKPREESFDLSQNVKLYEFISNIVSKYNDKDISIVLDGIHKPFSSIFSDEEAVQSLCICAFVHLMLGECPQIPSVRRLKSNKHMNMVMRQQAITSLLRVKTLTFLTGDFQTLDIPSYEKFMTTLIADLQTTSSIYGRVSMADITQENLPPLDKNYQKTTTGITYKGTYTNFRDPQSGSWGSMQGQGNAKIIEHWKSHFSMSYTKRDLQTIFSFIASMSKKYRPTLRPFIEKVAHVNHFRDAFRADVAIHKDAIFITGDRLSHVYYVMRCAKEGIQDRNPSLFVSGTTSMSFGFA